MALTTSHFTDCTVKDFYESMLYFAQKMDKYLDIMNTESIYSGKYIDAKAMYSEWQNTYDAAREALDDKFGKTMRRQIVKMIDSDLALEAQRRKLFA